jgi:3-oxochol-4-en-24-oyl-CoA dehydrogenase
LLRRTFEATLRLTGRTAMVADADADVVPAYLHLPAELIGGGTMEIQLNIIAQMILGLPRK